MKIKVLEDIDYRRERGVTMTIEEILAGESKNVEFKETLPEKPISDSCEPTIIPDITLRTVDGKTVIVVEISEGRQRPYYIKALGRDGGVYVRVAGTTRLADEYMIKELMFEGSNRYFDQALCTGLTITDEDIDALCKAMKEQALKNAHNEEQKASIKDVGRQQLRSWGVLIERDGKDYPSNAFAILTGNGGLHVTTQCGVFKGTTKAVFVDRREYPGPLWEQIDEAFQFVLRNIHLGAAALAYAFAYDNNIKNGVNVDTNSIDGVGIGTNDIKNDVDEVAYTDKVFPDHIQKLLKIIAENPTETQAQYAEKLGISKRTISRIFAELKEQGILEQKGNRRKAKWLIIKKR